MPTTLETTVDGIVRKHAGEAEDAEFLSTVIQAILDSDDPAKLLRPMLRGYLLGRRRAITRALEHNAFREMPRGSAEAVSAISPLMRDRLQPLLSELIYIPGAGHLTWGNATAAQLQARIDMYEVHRKQIDYAISDLQAAVRLIHSVEGAGCLNDVYSRS